MKKYFAGHVIALIAFGILCCAYSSAHAGAFSFLRLTSNKGVEIHIDVSREGTFKTPPLKAGKYKWQWSLSNPTGAASGYIGRIKGVVVKHEILSADDAKAAPPIATRLNEPITITKKLDTSTPLLFADLGKLNIKKDCAGVKGMVQLKLDSKPPTVLTPSNYLGPYDGAAPSVK